MHLASEYQTSKSEVIRQLHNLGGRFTKLKRFDCENCDIILKGVCFVWSNATLGSGDVMNDPLCVNGVKVILSNVLIFHLIREIG